MKLSKGALGKLEIIVEQLSLSSKVVDYLKSIPSSLVNLADPKLEGIIDFEVLDLEDLYKDSEVDNPYGVDKAPQVVVWIPSSGDGKENQKNFAMVHNIFSSTRPEDIEGELVSLDVRYSSEAMEVETAVKSLEEEVGEVNSYD